MANSKRKCKNCGVSVRTYIVVNNSAFCSYESATKWGYANKNKGKSVRIKAFNKETKRRKESIKKRTGANGFYANLATELHYYVKHILRKGEPCYTCGLKQCFEDSGGKFHVGHFIPQKSVDPRRFMLENLRMQCYSCNAHNSGMRVEYKQHMIEDEGIEHVEWLECDANHKSLKEQYPEVSDIKSETARYRKLNQ